MKCLAYRSRALKCVGMCVAVAALSALGGCSSSASRFDFPSFGLAKSGQADPMATASVGPVPSETVYGGNGGQGGSIASRPLPPIGSQPEPNPYASYRNDSPAPQIQQAAYTPAISPRKAYVGDEKASRAGRNFSATHRVESGDTLYGIARRHKISPRELASHNDLSADSSLRMGQVLKVPDGSGKSAPARVERAVARNDAGSPAVRVVKTVAIEPPANNAKQVKLAAGPIPAPAPNPDRGHKGNVVLANADASESVSGADKERPVQRNASLPEPEPMTGNSFRWPVKGKIISEFGTKPNGSHNDGINVAVPQGTSVKAAENGVVAYAGSELKGYGKLILIRHANNWVSAYAHNDDIMVKRGDKVRRGQIISKAGSSGSVSQPQVHFELRKGSRPVDPTKYMKDA